MAYFPDPFKGLKNNNVIVLCECYKWVDKTCKELVPAGSNLRYHAKKVFEKVKSDKCWFGIEQEYTILKHKTQFGA